MTDKGPPLRAHWICEKCYKKDQIGVSNRQKHNERQQKHNERQQWILETPKLRGKKPVVNVQKHPTLQSLPHAEFYKEGRWGINARGKRVIVVTVME